MSFTRNEKLSIYNGLASTASVNMVNGYIPLFAISVLGATNSQIALITSLPSIIGMLALIPGAIWLNKSKSKKNFTVASTLATRLLFMLILFVPFFSETDYAAWLLVGLIALLNFPGALSNLSWQSMIGDLIPEERRGNFFSSRNKFNTMAALVVTLSTGLFLSLYDKTDPFPYQVLFAAGFLFALLEGLYLFKHKENLTMTEKNNKINENKSFSLSIFHHKPYRAFLVCALLYNISAQMGWSIFSIYHIKEANATALWFSLFSVTNQIAQIISMKWWAKFADRWGNNMLLFVATAGMASAPVLTILSTNLTYITLINVWIGIFVAGTNLLLFNQLLKATPDATRTNYIANYNFLLSIVGFIAPQFGVFLLNALGMNSAMSLVSMARFAAAFSFLFVAVKLEKRQLAEAL
ncbi:MFS transporter [Bacillus sp. V59.32b]|uniref:MFS transporter n=1 Tax=Bacillus sp. V59.32b TaxID=1758642 RepID=UPI000E3ED31A|nr:MFS transporter [Bacillus sp. V59.32b]RFU68224.1 MFS transporter [Bacillus sp. V59.32b]